MVRSFQNLDLKKNAKGVTLCGWGVKAGMVRVWVAGKTANTGHI